VATALLLLEEGVAGLVLRDKGQRTKEEEEELFWVLDDDDASKPGQQPNSRKSVCRSPFGVAMAGVY
jgi:hypothetical protein